MQVVRCAACDGYGWVEDRGEDDFGAGEAVECGWCGGIGYVYRDDRGVDRAIPPADFDALTETLEQLEQERLRELGYSGTSKKPWEQRIRRERGDNLSKLGDPDEDA